MSTFWYGGKVPQPRQVAESRDLVPPDTRGEAVFGIQWRWLLN